MSGKEPVRSTARIATRHPHTVVIGVLLSVCFLGGNAPTRAQGTPAVIGLQEAMQKQLVTAFAEPIAEQLQEPMLLLHLTSRVESPLDILVSQGTQFLEQDGKSSDLVLVNDITLTVVSQASEKLTTLGLQHNLPLPSSMHMVTYTVGAVLTDPALVRVLHRIVQQPQTALVVEQLAVWAAYEGLSAAQVGSPLGNQVTADDICAADDLAAPPTPTAIVITPIPTMLSTVVVATPVENTIVAPTPKPKDGNPSPWLALGAGVCLGWLIAVASLVFLIIRFGAAPRNTREREKNPSPPVDENQSDETILTGPSGEVDKITYPPYAYQLVAIDGPLIGLTFAVDDARMVTRNPVVWIDINNNAVSRPHAVVDLVSLPRVKDLRSLHGTRCGDRTVGEQFVPIRQGDLVCIGAEKLRVTHSQIEQLDQNVARVICSWQLATCTAVVSREKIPTVEIGEMDADVANPHALLYIDEAAELKIKDLCSLKGTYVDDHRIVEPALLRMGSRVKIGASVFQVQVAKDGPLPVPCEFSHYQVEKHIATGGMAHVYLAFDKQVDRPAALKFALQVTDEFRQRFIREASVTRRLNHPNIVKLTGDGTVRGLMYLALEYIDGCSLDRLLYKGRPLAPGTAIKVIRSIAKALDYSYGENVICHRDIKPSNILLDIRGQAYLSDFGIAKCRDDPPLTVLGQPIGTAKYMSPEAKKGDPHLDQQTDIYALGIVLYETLGGRKSSIDLADVAELQQTNPLLTEALMQFIAKCIHPERTQRYASMADLITALPDHLPEDDLAKLVTDVEKP
jgi:pSer/pThr/pTyr-binding forkhead associated (FHA) protein